MARKKIKTNDVVQILLLCLLLSASAIRMYNNYVVQSDKINVAIKYGLIFLALIFIFINNSRLFRPIFFVICMICIVFTSYLIFPENRLYIQATLRDYWIYIIVIFLCSFNADYRIIEKSMIISACVIFLFDMLLFVSPNYYHLLVGYSYGGVGAVFSYSLLFPAVVFLYLYKKSRMLLYLVPSFVAAFVIVFYGGNRTATLCYFSYVAYVFFLSGGQDRKKSVIKTICFMFGIVLIVFNLTAILSFVSRLIGKEGYSSRIIEQFLSGTIASSSGRTKLQQELFSKLFTFEGVIGFGINGDRVITSTHEYSHNIFLELLIEFGWVMGSLVIIALVYLSIKVIRKKKNFNNIIYMLFSIKLIALMFSGTFWNDIYFWMFIAICMRSLSFKFKYNSTIV